MRAARFADSVLQGGVTGVVPAALQRKCWRRTSSGKASDAADNVVQSACGTETGAKIGA